MTSKEEVNIDNVSRYVELDQKKRILSQEIEDLQEKMDEIGEEILADMLETGSDLVRLAGRASVKCSTRLFCFKKGGVDKSDFYEALRSNGYGDFIREDYSWQTLTATLKELREQGEDFPQEILDLCSVQLRSKLTVYPLKGSSNG